MRGRLQWRGSCVGKEQIIKLRRGCIEKVGGIINGGGMIHID
jgi:hypothetical protein